MRTNHLVTLVSLVSLVGLCACHRDKPYTIIGTLDLPDQIPFGDTIIDVPSFEDTWVYLLDFDNQLIDSAKISQNTFRFEGKVNSGEPYFVQFVSQLGSTLIAIEPGDIDVLINPDITVTGTPSNDGMTGMDDALEELNSETYEYLAFLTDSLRNSGEELADDVQMQMAERFRDQTNHILDSIYDANRDNLAAAYAVIMRNIDVQSADEFEQAMKKYPKSIQQNELVQITLRSLRQYEMSDDDDSITFDPQLLGVEELDADQKP